MKAEIDYSETGMFPVFNFRSTAKDIPANDTTDPSMGYLNLLNNNILIESEMEIINPIEIKEVIEVI